MCEEEKCFRICWYFNCLWCTLVQVSLGHAVTSPKMTCEYQQTISSQYCEVHRSTERDRSCNYQKLLLMHRRNSQNWSLQRVPPQRPLRMLFAALCSLLRGEESPSLPSAVAQSAREQSAARSISLIWRVCWFVSGGFRIHWLVFSFQFAEGVSRSCLKTLLFCLAAPKWCIKFIIVH